MRNFLQLFFILISLFMATTLELSAQVSLDGTVTYLNGTFTYSSGNSTPYRVCPTAPISLSTGSAASACAGRGGVTRAFFVAGSLGGGDQTEITPTQPGNIVTITVPGYFRYCVRCDNGDMIESDPIFFTPSPTTEEGEPCASALPVELTSFYGKDVDAGVVLEWTTASEINNEGFEIEYSVDARNFETIGFVTGNGTITETRNYAFTHKVIRPGSLYYRLKQIDFDGAYEYSEVIEVLREKANDGNIVVFPNPAKEKFTVNVSNPERLSSTITVSDIVGQVIYKEYFQAGEAPEFYEKEFFDLKQHMYIVTVRVGTKLTTRQVSNPFF